MDNTILQKGLNMGLNLFNAAKMIFKSKKLYHSYIEAISNSIDSIKERLQSGEQFTPKINIMFLTNNNIINSIKIIDNGVGFNNKNYTAFKTAFSDNKSLAGGKGCGHLSWIVEAKGANINSTYIDIDKQYSNIKFTFDKDFENNHNISVTKKSIMKLKQRKSRNIIFHTTVLISFRPITLVTLLNGNPNSNLQYFSTTLVHYQVY